MSEQAEATKAALRRKSKPESGVARENLLGTGSVLLNLACSGFREGGFLKGHYYLIVGDSTSGKTWLSLTCFAEAAKDDRWKDYRFIYDGAEGGALMDVERFFGGKVKDRMEPPSGTVEDPIYSYTVEEFYYHVHDALEDERPFIYVLDSQDSLSSDAEVEKFGEQKEAFRKGRDASGSYGDNKAKLHSANLRRLMGPLKRSGSILIVLNQSRDSFNPFQSGSYSGGRALKFYATLQLWSSVKGKIEKTVRGKKRELGIQCKIAVKKNRMTGRNRTVVVPIFHSVGFDDVGSCVGYLVEEGMWKESSGTITVKGLGPERKMRREKLIAWIEEEGMEGDVATLVEKVWNEVEAASSVKRKRRYE